MFKALAPLESTIANIRNNIGAHRSAKIGGESEALWEELNIETFIHLINQIPGIIEAVRKINIYDWSSCESNTVKLFGCKLNHDWDNAFTKPNDEQDRMRR